MSSSCPKLCAALARSAAVIAVRSQTEFSAEDVALSEVMRSFPENRV
jgi:hypothetical protein